MSVIIRAIHQIVINRLLNFFLSFSLSLSHSRTYSFWLLLKLLSVFRYSKCDDDFRQNWFLSTWSSITYNNNFWKYRHLLLPFFLGHLFSKNCTCRVWIILWKKKQMMLIMDTKSTLVDMSWDKHICITILLLLLELLSMMMLSR